MKIAVLIPLYNGEKCLSYALDSVLKQTRIPDIVIIVDDCSKDNSSSLIKNYSSLNIHYERNEKNLGMICNWNRCLEVAKKIKPDIVCFLHQDDGYLETFIEVVENDFENNEIDFWSCNDFNKNQKTIPQNYLHVKGEVIPKNVCMSFFGDWEYVPAPTSVCFKFNSIMKVGAYDENYKYVAEPDLYLKLIRNDFKFYRSSSYLVWRTVPKERASEFFASSTIFLKEWEYFQKSNVDLLDRNSQVKRNKVFVTIAANSVYLCLKKQKFKMAVEVFSYFTNRVVTFSFLELIKAYKHFIKIIFWEAIMHAGLQVKRIVKSFKNRIINTKEKVFREVLPYEKAAAVFEKKLKNCKNSDEYIELFKEHSIYDLFSFYLSGNGPHYQMPWNNLELTKFPMDCWIYSKLIAMQSPSYIIEIGTQRGNSALMLSDLTMRTNCKVITLDIIAPSEEKLQQLKNAGVDFILADATKFDVLEKIEKITRGSKNCLIIDDGSHLKEHVLSTFELLNHMVPSGGYYVVEDAFSNKLIGLDAFDAHSAVSEILDKNKNFINDIQFNKFILSTTFNTVLRKI